MATVVRPPTITRIWRRDPWGVAVRAQDNVWQNPLLNTLKSQDQFYGLAGPSYDYPNPRGYAYPHSLRYGDTGMPLTLRPEKINLAGTPNYDWPNPVGYKYPISLRGWIAPLQLPLYALEETAVINYDQPNPRGPLYSIDLRTWINQGNIQFGRVIGVPTLAFSSDKEAVTCTASDSPSGQNWSGAGFMARYEMDTSIQIEGIFMDALNNVYTDPTEVQLFIKDPAGVIVDYTTLNGTVIRQGTGHYVFTFVPSQAGTWTYKWQGTGAAPATSPDTTFTINASVLI
jgi:hypothetical protein